MARAPKSQRQIVGSIGGLTRWSRERDRSAATRPARQKSPSSIEYHLERLGPDFDDATPEQRNAAAEAARKAYYARLSLKGVQARQAKGGRHAATA